MSKRILSLFVLCGLFAHARAQAERCGPMKAINELPPTTQADRTFYKKLLVGPGGIPIVGSEKVQDEAMYR